MRWRKMPANDFAIGALYVPGGIPGYFTQPGGIGTQVFPAQVQASSDYLSVKPFTELTGTYLFGCEHSANEVMVFRSWDYTTNMSVAILACPICTYVQRTIEPFEAAVSGNDGALLNSILYP